MAEVMKNNHFNQEITLLRNSNYSHCNENLFSLRRELFLIEKRKFSQLNEKSIGIKYIR